jgi:hypothetical protein
MMSKVYVWPTCTVADCGHTRHHGSEVRARKYAKKNQRRLTTKEGNAVCICHADAAGAPITGDTDNPREFFTCTEGLVEAATEAGPQPEPEAVTEPAEASQPLDPRDTQAAQW